MMSNFEIVKNACVKNRALYEVDGTISGIQKIIKLFSLRYGSTAVYGT